MTNDYFRYFIGFAASQVIPPDAIAIVEVYTTWPMDAITRHELFVDTLTNWSTQTPEGQQLVAELDGPATIGAILDSLDSLCVSSLEFWLSQAGLFGFKRTVVSAVFDLDLEIIG